MSDKIEMLSFTLLDGGKFSRIINNLSGFEEIQFAWDNDGLTCNVMNHHQTAMVEFNIPWSWENILNLSRYTSNRHRVGGHQPTGSFNMDYVEFKKLIPIKRVDGCMTTYKLFGYGVESPSESSGINSSSIKSPEIMEISYKAGCYSEINTLMLNPPNELQKEVLNKVLNLNGLSQFKTNSRVLRNILLDHMKMTPKGKVPTSKLTLGFMESDDRDVLEIKTRRGDVTRKMGVLSSRTSKTSEMRDEDRKTSIFDIELLKKQLPLQGVDVSLSIGNEKPIRIEYNLEGIHFTNHLAPRRDDGWID